MKTKKKWKEVKRYMGGKEEWHLQDKGNWWDSCEKEWNKGGMETATWICDEWVLEGEKKSKI